MLPSVAHLDIATAAWAQCHPLCRRPLQYCHLVLNMCCVVHCIAEVHDANIGAVVYACDHSAQAVYAGHAVHQDTY